MFKTLFIKNQRAPKYHLAISRVKEERCDPSLLATVNLPEFVDVYASTRLMITNED